MAPILTPAILPEVHQLPSPDPPPVVDPGEVGVGVSEEAAGVYPNCDEAEVGEALATNEGLAMAFDFLVTFCGRRLVGRMEALK